MTTWLLLNSIGLAIVAAVLYLVLRQLGFVLRRVGPVSARSTPVGPRVGENLTSHIRDLMREGSGDKATLLVFVSDVCAICAAVKAGAETLAEAWKRDAQILLVYDCNHPDEEQPLRRLAPSLFVQRSIAMRTDVGVTFVPFAVVMDRKGLVIGKGLVNDISHLESLLELAQAKQADAARLAADVHSPAQPV
jgi:methylamine dehydrogenase accessory protein MauD